MAVDPTKAKDAILAAFDKVDAAKKDYEIAQAASDAAALAAANAKGALNNAVSDWEAVLKENSLH